MSVLWWVLLGFLAYWVGLFGASQLGYLPDRVRTQGPIITVHTTRGRDFLERLARARRFWRAWGNVGLGIALVIMVGMFLVVVNSAIASMRAPETTAVTQPRNVLVIPGVNEFLPLSAAPEILVGLLVGLVVHEGGHGLLCRVEDIEIDSMGVALLAIIPIGAFVQPDETSQRQADRGGQSRMFAAGVMNNFAMTVIAFVLLFGLVGALIAPAPGAAVGGTLDGSAAGDAGIDVGDRIVGIDGAPIDNATALESYLAEHDDRTVSVRLGSGESVEVQRSLLVVAAVRDGPAGLETGDRIRSVDGEPVHTEAGLREALQDRPVATVTTADGDEHTFPAGAYVPRVVTDGPFAAAGVPADGSVTPVITAIGGERVVTVRDAQRQLRLTEPGETVTVEAYLVGPGRPDPAETTPETFEVTLGTHPEGHGLLGVEMFAGVTGIVVDDFGTQLYPSERFLATLGGETDQSPLFGLDTFFGKLFAAMVLPIASLLGAGIEQNFAGFTGPVVAFYEVPGRLGAVDWLVFFAANALFWIGWINFNLGIFNCIPAFPLDGGHLLRACAESVVSRLPIDNRYITVKYVTVSVGLLMLGGLLAMLFGQGLLN